MVFKLKFGLKSCSIFIFIYFLILTQHWFSFFLLKSGKKLYLLLNVSNWVVIGIFRESTILIFLVILNNHLVSYNYFFSHFRKPTKVSMIFFLNWFQMGGFHKFEHCWFFKVVFSKPNYQNSFFGKNLNFL
jgi:hypothetical protein